MVKFVKNGCKSSIPRPIHQVLIKLSRTFFKNCFYFSSCLFYLCPPKQKTRSNYNNSVHSYTIDYGTS